MASVTVSGEIVFPPMSSRISGALVHIAVEEVTRADARSTPVARVDISNASAGPGQGPLPFSIQTRDLDKAKRYTVRVHVDVDGDGRVSAGDFVSTESYPVLAEKGAVHLRIQVRQV
jgi:uncharacterized lipoprotein YbaY